MLHAKMMPFLSEVYHGKLGRDQAMLNEYGGQKLEAQVVPGGIKIAAISQVRIFLISLVFIPLYSAHTE
jgi:calcium permeable stress-gated cation channel